jgi:hypothetical protein
MARTACLICMVSTVGGCCKNTLGKGSTSSRHITKLEQSTFSYIYDHSGCCYTEYKYPTECHNTGCL